MGPILRVNFDRELDELREAVMLLGSLARQEVAAGLQVFLDNDPHRAGEVIAGDEAVNDLRYQLERRCYGLLAREQPVAGDMRTIVSALIVTTELERIADHGKKIARICQRTAGEPRPIPLNAVSRLGEMALAMLDDTLGALLVRDAGAARAITARDDAVDALYRQIFDVSLKSMVENPRTINAGTYLIQVAHELERVADRATNIAERVIYAVEGTFVDLND